MRYFWLIWIVAFMALAGCAVAPVETTRPTVDVLLTEVEPGKWRLDYTFERPVRTVIFRNGYNEKFRKNWAPLWETPAIVRRNGLDTIYFQHPTTKASFWLDLAKIDQSIDGFLDFEPHGTAVATWQFALAVVTDRATIANGANGLADVIGYTPEARFTLSSPWAKLVNGTPVSGDVQLLGFEETYLYVGDLRPAQTNAFNALLDGDVPADVAKAFEQDMSRLFAFYRAKLGAPGGTPPMVLLHFGSDRSMRGFEGRVAEDGTIVLSVSGRLNGRDLARHRAELLHFLAHEVAHNELDATVRVEAGARDGWISEGFAEAMAYDALRAERVVNARFIQREYARDFQQCANALQRRALHKSVGEAHYSCGNLLAVMIAASLPEHNLYEFWSVLKAEQVRYGETELSHRRVFTTMSALGTAPDAMAAIKGLIVDRQSDSRAALLNAMTLSGLVFETANGQTLEMINLP